MSQSGNGGGRRLNITTNMVDEFVKYGCQTANKHRIERLSVQTELILLHTIY